jgi:hypothetical protein
MRRKVTKQYFLKLAAELNYNGAAIARRLGRCRQGVNARLRRLGH